MFQVVHPLGLFALGALAVPIVIHLWRRPLPVVRVGSLRPFLAHRRSSRARALQDWPVFLLRCTILAALALAFAGLHWTPRTLSPARWCLLLPGTSLQDAHLQDWKLRLREGFEPRWLAPGFPRITDPTDSPAPSLRTPDAGGREAGTGNLARVVRPPSPIGSERAWVRAVGLIPIQHPAASSRMGSGDLSLRAPVWSLLSQADQHLAAGSEACVFGPTWSSLFEGHRPSLANLRIQWHAVPTAPPVFPPPSAPRVGVVHPPDRTLDAGYVRAALQAMGAIVVSNEVPSWIFQLGSAPLPLPWDELERHGVRIVRDAPETAEPGIVSRRLDVGSQTVALRQRVVPAPGAPVFRDSHGEPWLTEERQGSVVLWHVAFRFHPDWTDWPLDGAFPAWWQEHLQPAPPDTTSIAPEQAAPRFVPDPAHAVTSDTQRPAPIDLRAGFWLLGAALFLVERILSRLPTQPRHASPTASGAS